MAEKRTTIVAIRHVCRAKNHKKAISAGGPLRNTLGELTALPAPLRRAIKIKGEGAKDDSKRERRGKGGKKNEVKRRVCNIVNTRCDRQPVVKVRGCGG